MNPWINTVAIKNCISLFWIDGLNKSIKNHINNGTTKLIKFVIKNLINSFKPPSYIDNLKIILQKFIVQFYNTQSIPKEIIISHDVYQRELLKKAFFLEPRKC